MRYNIIIISLIFCAAHAYEIPEITPEVFQNLISQHKRDLLAKEKAGTLSSYEANELYKIRLEEAKK